MYNVKNGIKNMKECDKQKSHISTKKTYKHPSIFVYC